MIEQSPAQIYLQKSRELLDVVERQLPQIQQAISDWRTQTAARGNATSVKRQVAHIIGPFLGPRASVHILRGVTDGGENLLSTIEPVLALFLGSRAAGHLVEHVVESVLVRS